MRGTGAYAELLRARFDLAMRKLGLDRSETRYELDCSKFKAPVPTGGQMSLGL
jgi:hypothetical protein